VGGEIAQVGPFDFVHTSIVAASVSEWVLERICRSIGNPIPLPLAHARSYGDQAAAKQIHFENPSSDQVQGVLCITLALGLLAFGISLPAIRLAL
jgi:hypothetical protein